MWKTQAPWLLIAILVVSYAALHVIGLILAGLVLSAMYLGSIRMHPRIRHKKCGGMGEHRSALFPWTHRKCPGCQGGRLIRWGAGQFGADHIRSEYRRGKEARRKAWKDHVWR